jgi:DNA-binding GntR family transcriptional regulator
MRFQLDDGVADRPNVPQVLVDSLREAIVDGRLPAGSRLNEVHLAKSLRVSRTPLREALMHLSAEGTVETIPRRGFFIRSLSMAEFENVYAIRAILDPAALKLAGIPSAKRLNHLHALNQKLARVTSAVRRISLDNAWHFQLVAACANHSLLDLIRQFMARTRRYELALLRHPGNAQKTVAEHKQIIAALRAGNLRRACSALRQNMQSGREPIIRCLQARQLVENRKKPKR